MQLRDGSRIELKPAPARGHIVEFREPPLGVSVTLDASEIEAVRALPYAGHCPPTLTSFRILGQDGALADGIARGESATVGARRRAMR